MSLNGPVKNLQSRQHRAFMLLNWIKRAVMAVETEPPSPQTFSLDISFIASAKKIGKEHNSIQGYLLMT